MPSVRKSWQREIAGTKTAGSRFKFLHTVNEAIFQTAAKIGAIILARAVQNPNLSDQILNSVRQKLG